MMWIPLQATIDDLTSRFDSISEERKALLSNLSQFVSGSVEVGQPANLIFICTHNSRRSMMAQLWAQAAAFYYKVSDVYCYSGGTEATEFNPRAIKAMQELGFDIADSDGANPHYIAAFAEDTLPVVMFSKTYDDPFNPQTDFAAIMTCSDADERCPLVVGAAARIRLTYDDPKDFDGTEVEQEKYLERAREIGCEMLYAFSRVH